MRPVQTPPGASFDFNFGSRRRQRRRVRRRGWSALFRMQRTRLSLRNACNTIISASACSIANVTTTATTTRAFHYGLTLRTTTNKSPEPDASNSKPKITKKKYSELSSALFLPGSSLKPLGSWDGGLDAPLSSLQVSELRAATVAHGAIEAAEEGPNNPDVFSALSGICTPNSCNCPFM